MIQEGASQAVQLTEAETRFGKALVELHRAQVVTQLQARQGLHYASVGEERTGPHVVVCNGEVLGECHTKTPGVFGQWFAQPVNSSKEQGPFSTARAAAASLKPTG